MLIRLVVAFAVPINMCVLLISTVHLDIASTTSSSHFRYYNTKKPSLNNTNYGITLVEEEYIFLVRHW